MGDWHLFTESWGWNLLPRWMGKAMQIFFILPFHPSFFLPTFFGFSFPPVSLSSGHPPSQGVEFAVILWMWGTICVKYFEKSCEVAWMRIVSNASNATLWNQSTAGFPPSCSFALPRFFASLQASLAFGSGYWLSAILHRSTLGRNTFVHLGTYRSPLLQRHPWDQAKVSL